MRRRRSFEDQCKAIPSAVVYAILCTETQRVKVGYTLHIPQRFSTLRSESPTKLELLGYVCMIDDLAAKQAERKLHEHLSPWRVHGEWFRYEENVPAIIARWVTIHPMTYWCDANKKKHLTVPVVPRGHQLHSFQSLFQLGED